MTKAYKEYELKDCFNALVNISIGMTKLRVLSERIKSNIKIHNTTSASVIIRVISVIYYIR